tara:strand:+ start:282 stop:491 length:210 start_codon:yes stop_codon:yes gene_type:complete
MKIFILAFLFLIFTTNSYAYLDPVTGYALFQAIIAAIVAVYGFIILKPYRFLKKLFKKNEKNENLDKKK